MQPLVSVCVLTWNHENYIVNCLQSIVDQEYGNIEIVYLDNCSSDETYRRASDFLSKQNIPFRCFKNKTPLSIPVNANFLISKAKGKYACIISGDDWMTPSNISHKLKRIVEDNAVALVYSEAYTYIEPEDKTIERYGERSSEGYVFDELVRGNFISAPGSLVDIEKVKAVGGFNEHIMIEDWDLWLRLSQKYKIAYVKEHLVYYRRHDKNTSAASNLSYLKSILQILDQYKGHKHYPEARELAMKELIYNSIIVNPSFETLKLVIRNFRFQPFYFKQSIKALLSLLKAQFKKKS